MFTALQLLVYSILLKTGDFWGPCTVEALGSRLERLLDDPPLRLSG